jgi:hypothetical protein
MEDNPIDLQVLKFISTRQGETPSAVMTNDVASKRCCSTLRSRVYKVTGIRKKAQTRLGCKKR